MIPFFPVPLIVKLTALLLYFAGKLIARVLRIVVNLITLLLRIIWTLLALPFRLIRNLITYPYRKTLPKTPGKKFFSWVPDLRSPQEAATFAVQNIDTINFFQLGDIEKAVGKVSFPRMVNGRRVCPAPNAVLYGCRVLQPICRMKDISKIASRWELAWHGPYGMGGVLEQDRAWVELCKRHWTPFLLQHIHRAIASSSKPGLPDVMHLFDPKL